MDHDRRQRCNCSRSPVTNPWSRSDDPRDAVPRRRRDTVRDDPWRGDKKRRGNKNRTGRIRTCNQGIMRTATASAASFEFVVWTIPSPNDPSLHASAVWSLHLPAVRGLGSGLAADDCVDRIAERPSPNLTDSTRSMRGSLDPSRSVPPMHLATHA